MNRDAYAIERRNKRLMRYYKRIPSKPIMTATRNGYSAQMLDADGYVWQLTDGEPTHLYGRMRTDLGGAEASFRAVHEHLGYNGLRLT